MYVHCVDLVQMKSIMYVHCVDLVQAQGLLQASALGRTLQSSYLQSYLGFQGGGDAALERSRGVVCACAVDRGSQKARH
jgi:hypothetical protein